MTNKTQHPDRAFWAICLVLGQIIETASSFFWLDTGRHELNGSVLVILGMVFWIIGFVGLFGLFKDTNPWYARLGLFYAMYGSLGGIAFGFEGLFSVISGIPRLGVTSYEKFPLQMNLVLYWAGPAFPLSLLGLGITMWVRKVQPWWIGLLIAVGGILFPVSRILRIELVAHVADLLLLIPLTFICVNFLTGQQHEKKLQP